MAAAAAALSRSRAVAGARTTGGLFFIFTLLSLLCLVTAHLSKDELEQLKGKIRKLEKDLSFQKVQMETASEVMDYYANSMDPLSNLIKKTSSGLPNDFPPMDGVMHAFKNLILKTKDYVDDQREEVVEKIEIKEQKLRALKKLIHICEEQQTEL